jgi:dolichol-phosphate mannosyltransferase
MKLVSIVLSFRNEEQNIAELVERIDKSLCQLTVWKYEIIFVNDQSDDNSETIIESLQKKYPIILINMSRRFGVGPCIIAGFRHAKGDAIVYMDADLQDPPEILPNLMSEYERGFDVVHTVRTKRIGESKIKMMITKLLR